jgi:hypothetical protein
VNKNISGSFQRVQDTHSLRNSVSIIELMLKRANTAIEGGDGHLLETIGEEIKVHAEAIREKSHAINAREDLAKAE